MSARIARLARRAFPLIRNLWIGACIAIYIAWYIWLLENLK